MSAILKAFANRRMAVILLLGFSSGLPFWLVGDTLKACLMSAKVDLATIGLFSLVGLPYTFKFLWAPLMDRYVPPLLGRRRGWMLLAQLALAAGILLMARTDPAQSVMRMGVLALFIAFFSASQDIVVDAYRTEALSASELGAGTSLAILGFRLSMFVSGSLALIMADHVSWSVVWSTMAAFMTVGVVATFLAPEPPMSASAPRTIADAVWHPLAEFFRRRGAVEILVFVLIFKLDVAVAQGMTVPFMMDIGFTKTDIGAVIKGVGLVATILGSLLAGAWMVRLGTYRALWVFGLLQGLSGLSYTALAILGHHYPMMVTAIAVEYACAGMGTVAYTAFLMSLCDRRYTATQFALFSSLMAFARVLVGTPTGWVAEKVGWPSYFVIATIIAVPGLLLLLRYRSWAPPPEPSLTSEPHPS